MIFRGLNFFPCAILLLFAISSLQAQVRIHTDSLSLKQLERTDLIDFVSSAFSETKVHRPGTEGTVHFSTIPVAPSPSGQGSISVSAINASFFMTKETNLSTIYFYPYTNFSTNYGISLTPYIWFPKNEWNGTGDFRVAFNGLRENGLGGGVPPSEFNIVDHSHIRTYFTAHTRIIGDFYLGTGYNLDYFYGVKEKDPSPTTTSDFRNYGIGTGSETVSSGVTLNFLSDTRRNSVNATGGYYMAVVLRVNRKVMGSTYDWSSIYLDGRKYYSFSAKRHKILGARAFYWGTFGDVPYFNLPATFEDPGGRAGRGYLTDRFRGAHMLFTETEYRFDITSHGFLGGVLFANLQSYTDQAGRFDYVLPAAGFGFRFKFNRHSDTNITLDFALGKEGWNWYLNLGEYF
ncbi:MAG: hypothetical protein SH819_07975 [Cytophagales bacterium]|nr:hypothetical protein [Cytophagales bacterium]